MKSEKVLQRRLRWQETLSTAVTAMRSLSAHHLRLARAALLDARIYREQVERILAMAGPVPAAHPETLPALLVVGSDLGLCGGYNTRLSDEAVRQYQSQRFGTVYCIGRRPVAALARIGVVPAHVYPVQTGVAGLTRLLLTVAQEVLADHLAGRIGTIHIVSARFAGVGAFTPVFGQLWPVPPVEDGKARCPMPARYVSRQRLMTVAVREFLFGALFQLLLDAQASEHGMRLVAAGSAGEWLESRMAETRRQLAALKREESTQELLDVLSGRTHARTAGA